MQTIEPVQTDGHEIGRFVGTFQVEGEDFTFHLFEKATDF